MKASTLLSLYMLACLLVAALAQPVLVQPGSGQTPPVSTSISAPAIYANPGASEVFSVSLTRPAADRAAPFFAPILSASQATALAWPIALGNAIQGAGHETVLHLETVAASYSSQSAHCSPGQASGPLWVVSFSGEFTPKRLPPGIDPPIYTRLTVSADMHGLGIIGLSMRGARP